MKIASSARWYWAEDGVRQKKNKNRTVKTAPPDETAAFDRSARRGNRIDSDFSM
jgi:hypothetical protein